MKSKDAVDTEKSNEKNNEKSNDSSSAQPVPIKPVTQENVAVIDFSKNSNSSTK
jgi:hypothetical protein